MKRQLLAMSIALTFASGMIACSNKESTGPEAKLVGTWKFDDTDMFTVLANIFKDYLVNQGISQTQASAFVDSSFAGYQENLGDMRLTMRLHADNTWEDNTGGKGTWHIDGNELTTIDNDGTVEKLRYFLDGDDLTLIFKKASFLKLLREDKDFDAESYELFNNILDEDDIFRIFLKRR